MGRLDGEQLQQLHQLWKQKPCIWKAIAVGQDNSRAYYRICCPSKDCLFKQLSGWYLTLCTSWSFMKAPQMYSCQGMCTLASFPLISQSQRYLWRRGLDRCSTNVWSVRVNLPGIVWLARPVKGPLCHWTWVMCLNKMAEDYLAADVSYWIRHHGAWGTYWWKPRCLGNGLCWDSQGRMSLVASSIKNSTWESPSALHLARRGTLG